MGKRLYSIQPKECRLPLEIKTINPKWSKIEKRLFLFDPTKIYDILDKGNLLNPLLIRHSVPFGKIFPDDKYGKCACGCGQILSGRHEGHQNDLGRLHFIDMNLERTSKDRDDREDKLTQEQFNML